MEQKIESLMHEISEDKENKAAIVVYIDDESGKAIAAMSGSRINLMLAINTLLESDAGKPFMDMLADVMTLKMAEKKIASEN